MIAKAPAGRIAFWVIGLVALVARLSWYGDPRLAIGTADTRTYVDSSRAALFSRQSWAGRRLITTNLVYKLVSARADCEDIAVSAPAIGQERPREIRSCYADVAVLQALVSIAGWAFLAFAVVRHLRSTPAQVLAGGIILLFGFTPQVAEWDSVLGSESLSLSLLAFSCGSLVELAFSLGTETGNRTARRAAVCALWLVSFVLWVFVRDVHLYAIPVTLLLLAALLLSGPRGGRPLVLGLGAVLAVTFLFGMASSKGSTRWQPSIQHSLETFVLPYAARVDYMQERFGMPAPGSTSYQAWFEHSAPAAYSGFLLAHPGFIVTEIVRNWNVFVLSYRQPYFPLASTSPSSPLSHLGEALHPDSSVFHVLDLLLVAFLVIGWLNNPTRHDLVWACVTAWLLAVGYVTLFFSFFGDTDGVVRHVAPSLEMLRLLMWLSLIAVLDSHLRARGTVEGSRPASDDRPMAGSDAA